MIKINPQDFIGKGAHRECYIHPEDRTKCIKVVYSDHDREGQREQNYYRHLEKRAISWEMIPKFYGEVDTNLGKGTVFDFIFDESGKPAKNFFHYLSCDELTTERLKALQSALQKLKNYMLEQGILTRQIDPKNISCKELASGEFHLYLVDNLDNTDFIPIASYIKILARKKVMRKWKRFESRMSKRFPHNQFFNNP
ncbi:MAG: hypothetical protein ACI9T7_001703 [Oleiphilaceae bacterium]|jgi:hypothetical protein